MFVRSSLKISRQIQRTVVRNYADAGMAFTFASQNQVFYNGANVRQVDVPSFSGSFGILPSHVPTLAVLKPGLLTVFEETGSKKFFVSSGSITINEDSSVQILAEEATEIENIDSAAARDLLNKANNEANSATSDEVKAEALIAAEVAEAAIKAVESA